MDVATFAELLRETAQHHDHYEKTHPKIHARQHGSTPNEAATAAGLYMEKLRNAAPR